MVGRVEDGVCIVFCAFLFGTLSSFALQSVYGFESSSIRFHTFAPRRNLHAEAAGRGRLSSAELLSTEQLPSSHQVESLRVGESIRVPIVSQQDADDVNITNRPNITVCRLADEPDIFLLRNILSKEECDGLISEASNSQLEEATTRSGSDARKLSRVAWLPRPDLASRVSPIVKTFRPSSYDCFLDTKKDRDDENDFEVEDLQVLRYERKGEYTLHHDGPFRIGTVIYYLNGIAGTWFPFADFCSRGGDDQINMEEAIGTAMVAPNNDLKTNLPGSWTPGEDGLLILGSSQQREIQALKDSGGNACEVCPGDAVLFYNFDSAPMKPDWHALHASLEATETKWIANHWFRLLDS